MWLSGQGFNSGEILDLMYVKTMTLIIALRFELSVTLLFARANFTKGEKIASTSFYILMTFFRTIKTN